ncbi:MAG TPA: MarR family transcriptional regulator [Pseudonocardiaceae bacterium]|jgi:DNA-binding MarR family transcriptional regulator|nr:MarR family transcriptional regulator [Pseudonocardiaceae bacterium]
MAPKRDDVEAMAAALFAVVESTSRAGRKLKNASLLRLLQAIVTAEPVRPSELAAHLEVHQSLITRQIRELEEEGKVAVAPDAKDGRAFVVSLTDLGRKQVVEFAELGLQRFMGFVRSWEPAEVREFTRLLCKFQETKAEYGESNPAEPIEPAPKSRRRSR